jgi:hypothetical protein
VSASVLADVAGWPGYLVRSDGAVFKADGAELRRVPERLDCEGYATVNLRRASEPAYARVKVHRLVAFAFLPPPSCATHQVRHLDGSRTNSHHTNLAWGSVLENAADREAHGRTARGSRNGSAKLCEAQVVEIKRRLRSGEKQTYLAREFGVCIATVNFIATGRKWAWLQAS